MEIDSRTNSIKVSDSIKESILKGEFSMGQRLPQRFLADRYNTTTTVVREALRHCEKDNLLDVVPRFGAIVKQIDRKHFYEKYIMREAFETMSARLANINMTPARADELRLLADECDSKLPDCSVDDSEKAIIHLKLHKAIADAAGVDELKKALDNISLSTMMINNAYNIRWIDEYPMWHTKLVEAIINGTTKEAEDMMRIHIQRGYEMEKIQLL